MAIEDAFVLGRELSMIGGRKDLIPIALKRYNVNCILLLLLMIFETSYRSHLNGTTRTTRSQQQDRHKTDARPTRARRYNKNRVLRAAAVQGMSRLSSAILFQYNHPIELESMWPPTFKNTAPKSIITRMGQARYLAEISPRYSHTPSAM